VAGGTTTLIAVHGQFSGLPCVSNTQLGSVVVVVTGGATVLVVVVVVVEVVVVVAGGASVGRGVFAARSREATRGGADAEQDGRQRAAGDREAARGEAHGHRNGRSRGREHCHGAGRPDRGDLQAFRALALVRDDL
jgi:hypothetical protein